MSFTESNCSTSGNSINLQNRLKKINLYESAGYSWLTSSERFRRIVRWAFGMCDTHKSGKLSRSDLYAGILLVHLELAKYTGAAACHPPTVAVMNELFDAADDDNSGYIDEEEFVQIAVVCCGQITSRVVVYYLLMIVLVPYIADGIIRILTKFDDAFEIGVQQHGASFVFFRWIDKVLTFGSIAEKLVATILSMIFVPKFFDCIDSFSKYVVAGTTMESMVSTSSECPDKKDD